MTTHQIFRTDLPAIDGLRVHTLNRKVIVAADKMVRIDDTLFVLGKNGKLYSTDYAYRVARWMDPSHPCADRLVNAACALGLISLQDAAAFKELRDSAVAARQKDRDTNTLGYLLDRHGLALTAASKRKMGL